MAMARSRSRLLRRLRDLGPLSAGPQTVEIRNSARGPGRILEMGAGQADEYDLVVIDESHHLFRDEASRCLVEPLSRPRSAAFYSPIFRNRCMRIFNTRHWFAGGAPEVVHQASACCLSAVSAGRFSVRDVLVARKVRPTTQVLSVRHSCGDGSLRCLRVPRYAGGDRG